jgi:two-component system chemotaxis response regulator CheB
MMKRTRVLIVDDSPTMRAILKNTLEADPEIQVVGAVGDPIEARQAVKDHNPDVLTLDVEMPRMDGLEFLERLMRLRPMPVVMVSSRTTAGADATIRALESGAIDVVAKPTGGEGMAEAFADLGAKVKSAARARMRQRAAAVAAPPALTDYRPDGRIVCIGSSTGGVEALLAVISAFPAECPPTLIVQHIPKAFTPGLAKRLDEACAARVEEAVDGAPLETGRVWLAPGGLTHLEIAGTRGLHCRLLDAAPVNGHRPSVDILFNSAARLGKKAFGVILTGMGRDGAAGMLAMRKAGADTIGQDEATSIIYGMPRAAFELGAVGRQLPLHTIGREVIDSCRLKRRAA